jgi:PAS domain S-box-containing protein
MMSASPSKPNTGDGVSDEAATLEQLRAEVAALQARLAAREQAEARARLLAELGRRALAETDPALVLAAAVTCLAAMLDVAYSAVLEYLPADDAFRLRATHGWDSVLGAGPVVAGGTRSQAGYTLRVGVPVVMDDLAAETRFQAPILAAYGVVSGICVPIPGPDGPWGALGVHSTRPRVFPPDDVLFLQAVAGILGAALERRRGEEALRRRAEQFQTLGDHAPDIIARFDRAHRYLYVNQAMERLTGRPVAEFLGHTNAELDLLSAAQAQQESVVDRVFAFGQEEVFRFELTVDGATHFFEARLAPEFAPDGTVESVLSIARDVTLRERTAQHLLVEYTVTRVLSEATSLTEAAPAILQAIGGALGWDLGVLWRVDAGSGRLRCSEVWCSPDAPTDLDALLRDQPALEPGRGLPGQVWADGAPIWIVDLALEADSPWTAAARAAGLRSALAFPIRLGGTILGVMEFLSRQPGGFDPDLLSVTAALGSQIGQFIGRTQVEEDLRRSRDQLAIILRGVADGITMTTPAGGMLYANEAAAQMMGYPTPEAALAAPPGEILSRFEILDSEGRPFPIARLPSRQAFAGADHPGMLLRFRVRATGEERWSVVRATPVRDPAGYVVSAISIFHDMTESRRATEAARFLAGAGTLLAASLDFETTLDNVAQLAVPALADWCYVDILEDDGTIRRLAAAHADPAKAELAAELRRFPPAPGSAHPVVEVLRTGRPLVVAPPPATLPAQITRDAEHLALAERLGLGSLMVVPLRARGRILGAITFLTSDPARGFDAAIQRLAEDLAERAAVAVDNARLYRAAQDAVRARDEFLSVAAHELRTPITSLRGYAQLALRQYEKAGPPDPERVHRAFQVIDQQSTKLAHLVGQLLDSARIEAGRLALERAPADVAELAANLVRVTQARTQQHTIRLDAPPALPATVDALRLEQVLTNLLDNAVKYSPDGGPVEVTLTTPGPDWLRITVTDHGIGIPPAQRERIFERFYQGHGPGSFGGMGLGLHISRQIVELHGGRIAVEGPPEGGTRFVVRLPVAAPPGPAAPGP